MHLVKDYVSDLREEFSGYNGKKLSKDLMSGITVAACKISGRSDTEEDSKHLSDWGTSNYVHDIDYFGIAKSNAGLIENCNVKPTKARINKLSKLTTAPKEPPYNLIFVSK